MPTEKDKKAKQEKVAASKAALDDGKGNEKGKKSSKLEAGDDWRPCGKKKLKALYGGIVKAQKPKEVGQFILKEWQELPCKILGEYCTKQKRPRPIYPPAKSLESGKSRIRLVLPDPSGKSEKDITLCPNESFDNIEVLTSSVNFIFSICSHP